MLLDLQIAFLCDLARVAEPNSEQAARLFKIAEAVTTRGYFLDSELSEVAEFYDQNAARYYHAMRAFG